MTPSKAAFLASIALLSLNCGSDTDKSEVNDPSNLDTSVAIAAGDTLTIVSPSLDTLRPIQFLEYLELEPGVKRVIMLQPNEPREVSSNASFNRIPADWLKAEEIDSLIELFADNSPTCAVYSIYADLMPTDRPTTKGIEAVRLVEGFRNDQYPSLWPIYYIEDSASTKLDSVKQELRYWWASRPKKAHKQHSL